MKKIKVFISSVQREFSEERKILYDYFLADPLLGKFFDPFIFEYLPATDQRLDSVYLQEVEQCDIYLGILGSEYGYEDSEGISPTEREFDYATKHHKTRFIFIAESVQIHPKELQFIEKVQKVLVRKSFSEIGDLKSSVYAAMVKYLIDKEFVRTAPFDAAINMKASIEDIDTEKIRQFIRLAKLKRGLALNEGVSPKILLTHLNLMDDNHIKNAAILLFGKDPQRFFITSEIRCAYFLGTEVIKPIQSYKVFKGDVFEMVDHAVEFVLSKLDYRIETRKEHVQVPGSYEIPKMIIAEAIVNAVVHRDYTSNASVQVMMFRDRVEVWNPGSLPIGWTTEKLKELHNSVPANPLLAEPMFIQEEMFRTIVYRQKTEAYTTKKTVEKTVEKILEKILELLKINPQITQKQIAKATGLSRRGVEWNLKKLKDTGVINRIGADKGGYWEVKKNRS